MFGTTIAPMAAAVNLIATSNQQTVNTIIAGRAVYIMCPGAQKFDVGLKPIMWLT